MPVYRGTLVMNSTVGTPTTGFTESFDFQISSDGQAITEVSSWPARRALILSSSFTIVGWRLAKYSASVVAGKCKKKLTSIQIDACLVPQVGTLGPQNSPYDGALVRMFRDDKGKAREWELRGIPDTWIDSGALTIPVMDMSLLNAWFASLKATAGIGKFIFGKTDCSNQGIALFTSICVQRLMSRRIGRPFGLLVGRRKKP